MLYVSKVYSSSHQIMSLQCSSFGKVNGKVRFFPWKEGKRRKKVYINLLNNRETQQMLSPDYRVSYTSSIGQHRTQIQHKNKINDNVGELNTRGQTCDKQQYYWTGNRFQILRVPYIRIQKWFRRQIANI